MSWIAAVWVMVAACSMGKDPAKKAPPPPPPPTGTITGHVTFEMHGPGRAHGPEESFTNVSPIECSVQAGADLTRTRPDGSYTLRVPVGHVDVSFADCAKNCCYNPSKTLGVDVTAGSAATADFVCECSAK